jgi:hypothetical protein
MVSHVAEQAFLLSSLLEGNQHSYYKGRIIVLQQFFLYCSSATATTTRPIEKLDRDEKCNNVNHHDVAKWHQCNHHSHTQSHNHPERKGPNAGAKEEINSQCEQHPPSSCSSTNYHGTRTSIRLLLVGIIRGRILVKRFSHVQGPRSCNGIHCRQPYDNKNGKIEPTDQNEHGVGKRAYVATTT